MKHVRTVGLLLAGIALTSVSALAQARRGGRLNIFPAAVYQAEPQIEAALMLTAEQRQKVQDAAKETTNTPALAELRKKAADKNLGDADRQAAQAQLRTETPKAQEELKKRIADVLNPEQKATIEKVADAFKGINREMQREYGAKIRAAQGEDKKKLQAERSGKVKTAVTAKLDGILSAAQKEALAKAKAK